MFLVWAFLAHARQNQSRLSLRPRPIKGGPGNPIKNPRASSGAMPVGAIFRTSFSPAQPGAVQCCGGVRCKSGSRATGCIAAGAAACQ